MNTTPTFAMLGAVNHGKSSIVSTLAEDDAVEVSSMPGATIDCRRFSLRDLFVFYDTPGFQNAAEALDELRPAADAADPLALYRQFIAGHRDDEAFEAEVRLFEPIVEGAGIIYVVDGSRPVLEINLAEMELLRLTGRPRLAIINRTSTDAHVAEWKRRLGLHFNAVREFNAHSASFANRIDLLITLASIEQDWQPKLMEAVSLLRAEREKQLDECAEIITDEIEHCLQHKESVTLANESPIRRAEESEKLKARYQSAVTAIEAKAHGRIIQLFNHRLVQAGQNATQLFSDDLFSEETWKMFGLDEKQLIAAGAATGAIAGAVVDLSSAGHTLGFGTLIGGAIGAGGSFLTGKRRPKFNVDVLGGGIAPALKKWLPGNLPVSGSALVIGPYAAPNFPWILLDRSFGVFAYLIARTHARREKVTLDAHVLHASLEAHRLTSAQWDAKARDKCAKIFAKMGRSQTTPAERSEVTRLIRDRLAAVDAEAIPLAQLSTP